MLAELLPSEVIVRECRIENAVGRLFPEEEQCVKTAVPRRRQEFLAGRACAREALGVLGVGPVTLPSNLDRTPAWPSGVVGSITHSTNHCAAAVALSSQIASVGIDIEEVSRFDQHLLPLVCTKKELRRLRGLPSSRREFVGAILFSAKESVYKCQFMFTRRWLGFHSVEIDLAPDAGEFHVKLPADLIALSERGLGIGKYAFLDDLIVTAVVIANT